MKEDAFGDSVAKVIQEKDPVMRAQVTIRIIRASRIINIFSLSNYHFCLQVMVEMLENVDLNKWSMLNRCTQ